jgi:uncharacterized protein (DUF2267 family)
MKYDELVKHVRQRAGIEDREEAARTVQVVIQALADRLTGDEAEDLLAQLPEPLKSSIVVNPEPEPLTANEFVLWVAEELELPEDDAANRVRAVFEMLRDAVTPGEFHDVLVQLPSGFFELIAGRA